MFSEIQVPTACPSCGGLLEFVNDLLYCRSTLCGGQARKKIEHFAKTLKIKGLGPAAIRNLDIVNIEEIYSLSIEDISEALSSEKLGSKLYGEIQNSASAPLELVLPAFGISLIGNSATKKLSKVVNTLNEVTTSTCEAAGLGPKATENLCNWLDEEFYANVLDELLPFNFTFSKNTTEPSNNGTICITGNLKSFKTKADATEVLNSLGYEVKSSLTKEVTILVNESGQESLKTKKARESGVTIVTNLNLFLEN